MFLVRSICRSYYHSQSRSISIANMKIRIIPALKDNYMYLLVDEKSKECAVVDPVEPDKVIEAAKEESVTITKVLTTHHHWDHASGNDALKAKLPNVHIYGGDDRVPSLMTKVEHGQEIKIGTINIQCLFTPCHTSGHICYLTTSESNQMAVFTGDTLFSGGCGRFFEGTPLQMHHALIEVLGELAPETQVFCGHEYTVANLRFAQHVEPDNDIIKKHAEWAGNKRLCHEPTVPSTIGEELTFNPFMRVGQESVQKHTGQCDPVKVMEALRKEKDSF